MASSDKFVKQIEMLAEAFMFRSMQNVIKYSKESGYSMSHIGTLMHLHHKGVSDVSGLGDKLGITYPAASQMLDRLVEKGLIQRTEDPKDRRSKKIVLTDKGFETLHESMKARQASMIELSKKMTDEEKEKVMEAFEIVLDKFKELNTKTVSEE
jgi:DNA-binding MarR family transcriptional regulator